MVPAFILLIAAQDAHKGIDQNRVDQAIAKGVAWLRLAPDPGAPFAWQGNSDEIFLLTFLHAGLPESDPYVPELLNRVTSTPLHWTYNVALQAMLLELLDSARFQPRIAECAQFLVDNQCVNGQWAYEGTPTPVLVRHVGRKVVRTQRGAGNSESRAKRRPTEILAISLNFHGAHAVCVSGAIATVCSRLVP